tara:strand:+ start:91 stop:1977 length:1887 start_codon:yes stop_codon:yes gene_type:complete
MAQTAHQFRQQERRKMRLQADLNARRNSLMNLVAPRGVHAEEGPGVTLPAPPHLTVSSNVVEPPISAPLPGRDIVDANNAEALALASQFPGQNLTDVYNSRAALRTGNDLANMRSAEVEQAARMGDFENQQAQNALDAQVAAPTTPTTLPAIQPTPLDYGPGLTAAAAEERYGPGGMYGTTPLPGGLYDQMGIAPTRMGSQGARQSTAAFPSDERLRSSSNFITDAVKKIKKRAGIIRGTAAMVGGDSKAADRYEAKALASLGIYAGQYGMSQLTDADFRDKQTLFQSLLEKNVPLDQIIKVLQSGVANAPTEKKEKAQSAFANSELYTRASRNTYLRTGNPADLVFTDKAVGDGIALKDIPQNLRDTAYINLLEKQLKDLDPNTQEYKEQSESLELLRADYNNNKWANAQGMRGKWVAASSAYDNVVNLSDRILQQLVSVDVTTGLVAGGLGVFEGIADQVGQSVGVFGGTAVDKAGNAINEKDLRDVSVYRDALNAAGVSAQLEGNIIELAYAIARLREPGGRLSQADVENAIRKIAPKGRLSKSMIAANIMQIDQQTYQRMFDTHRRFVENSLPVENFRFKRGPIFEKKLPDGTVWFGYNTLKQKLNPRTGKMEDWHETLYQGAD